MEQKKKNKKIKKIKKPGTTWNHLKNTSFSKNYLFPQVD